MHIFYCVVIIIFVLGSQCYALPFVRNLTKGEQERLASWTEKDNQNIWELSGQTEGDMVMMPGPRNVLIYSILRWPNNEIPFVLDPIFTRAQAALICDSLRKIEEVSCLKIRPRTANDEDYVLITGYSTGCWAHIGYQRGRQDLNLQVHGCLTPATIIHEFLHAAGFRHEQSSFVRDDYVDILWENIEKGQERNFDKSHWWFTTSFGERYDYESVMHYSAYAFSANGQKTIQTKDPTAEIGKSTAMSRTDVAKLNKMYRCESLMEQISYSMSRLIEEAQEFINTLMNILRRNWS